MRHHNANRKFGLKADQRKALLRSLAQALVVREKIQTTEAKAKELRPYVERLITRSRVSNVATRRFLVTQIGAQGAKKLVETLGPKFKDRNGGYTRIIKLPQRISDGSLMAQIELV
ncbi:50S ribosomal protein L17 [Patescibacteria group bacterium]|nr:50S ribosomal protein L17 [Patescibacteria group bacterium]